MVQAGLADNDAPRQAVAAGQVQAATVDVGAGGGGGKTGRADGEKIQSETVKNSVGKRKIIQSATSGKTTEKQDGEIDDDWRFEIKRKPRKASRKNSGSTARSDWYYWVIRVNRETGVTVYYGTLDVLDSVNPDRLKKYWRRSR